MSFFFLFRTAQPDGGAERGDTAPDIAAGDRQPQRDKTTYIGNTYITRTYCAVNMRLATLAMPSYVTANKEHPW